MEYCGNLADVFHNEYLYFCENYKTEKINYSDVEDPTAEFAELYESNYVHPKIRDTIITEMVHLAKTSKIHIYFDRQPRYKIQFLVFYTNWLLHILRVLKPGDEDVIFKIYLTSCTKRFPNDATKLTPLHVNSGVTFVYRSSLRRDVFVFREEEVCKVILHELIHALGLDMTHMSDEAEESLKKYFCKHGSIKVNESFTDTLTCILNVMSFSVILCRYQQAMGNKQHCSVLSTFKKYFERERLYILEKCGDVLLSEGYKINESGVIGCRDDTEDTHVTSYYILKALNIYYFEDFMKTLGDNGYTLRSEGEYISLLNDFIRRPDFWKMMQRKKKRFSESLRMSDIDVLILLNCTKSKLLKTMITQ